MSGPLAGVRVIEVGHMLMGPYCGMLLADLGAEVVKVEPGPAGDIGRSISPHAIGSHNAYFASLNRNKKSVVLDLASESGRDDGVKHWNPKIVCVALTGYGLESPYSERPAYDYVIQALTGIMALTGDPDSPPTKTGYSAVDNSAGIMGAVGLLAKLVEGKGGQVDIAMYDVMLSQLNYLAGAWLNAGERSSIPGFFRQVGAEGLGSNSHRRQTNSADGNAVTPLEMFGTLSGRDVEAASPAASRRARSAR